MTVYIHADYYYYIQLLVNLSVARFMPEAHTSSHQLEWTNERMNSNKWTKRPL